jgi:hypothetical protein
MKKFVIFNSKDATDDLENLSNVIMYKYKAPLTAVRYLNGLQNEIKKLEILADSLPFYTRPQLRQYGFNTKRIIYKEITVIFSIYGTVVYIHRVIPSNTIL